MPNLTQLILDKINILGQTEAAAYFGAPQPTVSLWQKGTISKQLAAAQKVLDEYIAQEKANAPAVAIPEPVLTTPSEPLTDLGQGKVTILMPVYRSIAWQTHATLFRNYAFYGPEKVEVAHWPGTLVDRARNILVERFLKSKSEWAILCDSDVVLPCGNAYIINNVFHARLPEPLASRNAISRLMSHDPKYRVVGALCYVKGDPKVTGNKMSGRAMCSEAYDSDAANRELHQPNKEWGLRKQDWFVGINFCRVHRSVFEEMARNADKLPGFASKRPNGPRGFFHRNDPDSGEDVSFCARCKQLGIELMCDTGLICGHSDGEQIWWHYNTI